MFPFLFRDMQYGLMYSGDIKSIEFTLDIAKTYDWYEAVSKEKDLSYTEEVFSIYGKNYKIKIIKNNKPNKNIDELLLNGKSKDNTIEDVTDDLYDFLTELSNEKMIDDILFGIWQTILESYVVIKRNGIVFFYRSTNEKIITNKTFNSEDEQSTLIMMKEYIDGYVARKDFRIKLGKQELDLELGTDYNITIPGTNEKDVIKGNFTNAIRYKAFYEASIERARKRYDKEGDYPLLYKWQYDLIKRRGKRTIFTNIRRAGKSLFVAWAMFSFLEREMEWITTRPIQIIYVGQNAKNMRPTMKYLKNIANKFNDKNAGKNSIGNIGDIIFKSIESQGLFQLKTAQNGELLAEIRFVADADNDPGVGDNCDFLVIDEVVRIKEKTRDLVKPFVENQNADLLMCSTMYKGIKKSRAYKILSKREKNTIKEKDIDGLIIKRFKELRKIEKDFEAGAIEYKEYGQKMRAFRDKMDSRRIGIRYTIDDNDKYTDDEKDRLKNYMLETDPEGYFSELYSRFSDDGKVFKYEKTIKEPSKITIQKYKFIIIGYDPARTNDIAAAIILGYDDFEKKLVAIEEYALNKDQDKYQLQVDTMIGIMSHVKKYLLDPTSYVYFCMDGTHRSIVEVFEAKGLFPYLSIVYTGGRGISEGGSFNFEMRVSKQILVEALQEVFKANSIVLNKDLKQLVLQLDNFYEIEGGKFEGIGEHDDFVNALMIGVFAAYETLGLKGELLSVNKLDTDGLSQYKTLKELIENRENKRKEESDRYNSNIEYYSNFIY